MVVWYVDTLCSLTPPVAPVCTVCMRVFGPRAAPGSWNNQLKKACNCQMWLWLWLQLCSLCCKVSTEQIVSPSIFGLHVYAWL